MTKTIVKMHIEKNAEGQQKMKKTKRENNGRKKK